MPPENEEQTTPEKTPEELAAEQAAREASAPRTLTAEDLDRKLAERDQNILAGMREMVTSILDTRQAPPPPRPEEVQQALNISPEDFYRDPQAALQLFFDKKIAPALKEARPAQPDQMNLHTAIELQKMKLKERYGDEEYKKYESFLNKVLEKTDMRVTATEQGMDAVYRLSRSYAEDAMKMEEKQRQERGLAANLESGGTAPRVSAPKTQLKDDEAAMASALGLSPEDYAKHQSVEEVEIGGARKKDKR